MSPTPRPLRPGLEVPGGLVPMNITLDGKRYGELFDFVVMGREKEP